MLSTYRKDYFIRILVVTAMVWGFALPIVHLVCAKSAESLSVLCDDHSGTENGHAAAEMSGVAGPAHGPAAKAELEARDVRIECCWIDANAVDRRAALPTLIQVPDLAVSNLDGAAADDERDVRAFDRAPVDDTAPPIAFRLLFAVFLI